MKVYHKFANGCYRLLRVLACVTVIAMLVLMLIEVVRRYFFGRTFIWSDEVIRYLLIYCTFLGGAAAYYKKALQVKALIKKAYDEAFGTYDLLLTPVAPATAPRLGESLADPLKMYLSDIYTVPLNLAGLPGLSMPCGFDAQGLPIGAQLIGPALGEARVLNAAHAFQQDTQFHTKMPKGGAAQ